MRSGRVRIFGNVRRRTSLNRGCKTRDGLDGKKSRRRAWSSIGKGEAKQTTLGRNPTRHWPVPPKVNKRGAPLSSSQSAQLLDPIVPFRCRPLTDAEMQIPVCTTFIGAKSQLISPWIWRRPQRTNQVAHAQRILAHPNDSLDTQAFDVSPFILKIGYSHWQKRRAHRYNTSKVESSSKYNQHPHPLP